MNETPEFDSALVAAAQAIQSADALLVGAGAGMGVDSGLPDFRGAEGFWKAYPPFRGRRFAEISTPHWFTTDPKLAWGFFGHRLHLYVNAIPHDGFSILQRWAARMPQGHFVFTSNVDGQFNKAGFDPNHILEIHGSIHWLQCLRGCGQQIWSSAAVRVDVDESTIRATSTLPTCPTCFSLARPNILMFGDSGWDESRCTGQVDRYKMWLSRLKGRRIVAIELGAGLAIPTVRDECEFRSQLLIRVNPRESETAHGIALQLGALDALRRIDTFIKEGLDGLRT
ncbi:NAD-dependent protein deacetylase [soil metagenome]